MFILQVEHKVTNYDGWKKLFDSDPINRKKSGVQRYRIFRPTDNPNYVIIDLEFDNLNSAETTLIELRKLWGQVDGKLIFNPETRILEVMESSGY
jgi:hypothetical protein